MEWETRDYLKDEIFADGIKTVGIKTEQNKKRWNNETILSINIYVYKSSLNNIRIVFKKYQNWSRIYINWSEELMKS